MKLVESILAEFDNEMALARRVLARAPESAFSWRPHEKSWTLAGMCSHLARVPKYGTSILRTAGYDLVKDAGPPVPDCTRLEEILAMFDTNVGVARDTLVGMTDAELALPWALTRDNVVLMSLPRLAAFKRYALNHVVHHRGQLTIYLRMNNVPLPALYGPTADEGF